MKVDAVTNKVINVHACGLKLMAIFKETCCLQIRIALAVPRETIMTLFKQSFLYPKCDIIGCFPSFHHLKNFKLHLIA